MVIINNIKNGAVPSNVAKLSISLMLMRMKCFIIHFVP